jgi:15-cis-phytoene synthase
MTIDACAALVRQGDPDRFLSAMTAPVNQRAQLLVLYAFNLELARVAWVTAEPMIAEMRLQFWADAVEDIAASRPPRAHEVAGPLAEIARDLTLPTTLLARMVTARQFDIYPEPHVSQKALIHYIDDTAGNLLWLAALSLGARGETETTCRKAGFAFGTAALLQALPALILAGRQTLPDTTPDAIQSLAQSALASLEMAKKAKLPKDLAPALRAGWLAGSILRRAAENPHVVLQSRLRPSEFARRTTLITKTALSTW